MLNSETYTDPYAVGDALDDWSEIHSEGESDDIDAPYSPPRVPVGLPHVVRFATESGDLSWKERSIVITLARYANHQGVASVAVSTLCKVMRIGSKNTVERALNLAAHGDVGILKKDSHKGGNGKARKSNIYTFGGKERNWEPLPQTRPGVPPVVALARANRRIEQQDTLIKELQAELARLRNGHTTTEQGVDGHNGHNVTIEKGSEVTNVSAETLPSTGSPSYETSSPIPAGGDDVFDGPKQVTIENAGNESQEYLARRARVEALVMEFREHFRRSFTRGIDRAVHYFAETAEKEQELLAQVATLRADQEAEANVESPPDEPEKSPSGHRGVEPCPDCDRPFTTHGGAEYCPDCTERRRRGGGS